jgi:site-specific recombinase XerD
MSKLNPQNERIKRDFLRYQKNALGKSDATLDAIRRALARFENYTGRRDFKTFRREQAIGFKERLMETDGQRSGETLSRSTLASTLAALKDFFRWLAWQPGFKSKIHVPDIDYFNPSNKDLATAKATKLRDFPDLDQVRAVIDTMPADTVIKRRNRALIAFAMLTGIRDGALISLSLRHVDLSKSPPLVRQEPDRVQTKFAKTINTYFYPLGDDLKEIVVRWVEELRQDFLFGPNSRSVQSGSRPTTGAMRHRSERSFGERLRASDSPTFRPIRCAIRLDISCTRSVARPERLRPGAKI